MDAALAYIKEAGPPSEEIDEKNLVRKIDWRIVPIMFACCTIQFVDKILLNARFSPLCLEIPPSASSFALTLFSGCGILVCRRDGSPEGSQSHGQRVHLGGNIFSHCVFDRRSADR